MPLMRAKQMIHQINNKLTGALGFVDLAIGDSINPAISYLNKANRELKEAAILLKQVMGLVEAIAEDTVKAASEAAEEAQRSAKVITDAATVTRIAADKVAAKTEGVLRQLSEVKAPIRIVRRGKKKK